MSGKKFRRHKKKIQIPKEIILPVKQNIISISNDQQISHEFNISEADKIRYVYARNNTNLITNIISVSYNIYLIGEWVTIIYYDSEHGYLHRHETISLDNRNDVTTEENIRKKGSKEKWLTWAIKDIQKRYIYYKTQFLKRSNLTSEKLW